MKKLLIGLTLLASISSFAYDPVDTPDTPDAPRVALHSACVSIVESSGANLTEELDRACENMSSAIDIAAVSEVSKVKRMTVSFVQACTDVPSFNELECIEGRVLSEGQRITAVSISSCK